MKKQLFVYCGLLVLISNNLVGKDIYTSDQLKVKNILADQKEELKNLNIKLNDKLDVNDYNELSNNINNTKESVGQNRKRINFNTEKVLIHDKELSKKLNEDKYASDQEKLSKELLLNKELQDSRQKSVLNKLSTHDDQLKVHEKRLNKAEDKVETTELAIKGLKANKVDQGVYETDKEALTAKVDKEISDRQSHSKIFNNKLKNHDDMLDKQEKELANQGESLLDHEKRLNKAEDKVETTELAIKGLKANKVDQGVYETDKEALTAKVDKEISDRQSHSKIFNNKLKNHDDMLDKQEKELANQGESLLDHEKRLNKAEDKVETTELAIKGLKANKVDQGVYETDKEALTAKVDKEISDRQSHSKIFNNKLKNHDDMLDKQEKELANQGESLLDHEKRLNKAEDKVETTELAIKGLKANKVDQGVYETDKEALTAKVDKEISDRQSHSKIFNNKLKNHDDMLDKQEKELANQGESLLDHEKRLNKAEDKVETTELAIKGLKANKVDQGVYETDKEALTAKVDKEISDRQSHSKIFNNKLKNHDDMLDKQEKELANHKNQLLKLEHGDFNNYEDKFNNYENKLHNINTSLFAYTDKLDQHSGTLDGHTEMLGQHKDLISTKADKSYVENIEKNLTINTATISENRKQINTNTATISENRKQINTNTATISENRKQINTNTATISENRKQINTNTANISENRKQINTNTANIEMVRSDIQNMNNRVDNLNDQINHIDKKMASGLASVAAMTMVDMAKASAGTVNVGAAVGGFNGTHAVAVGVGYAPTDSLNITTKIGVNPAKHKYITYGAGVNYQFSVK
ncbi:YadA-like family protein [Fusobacterium sp.]|uniref:YadA-like family protein n=1 Tax=Fusobacterium sp. TaxID=68766 RepID=UPI000C704E3D|nr:YadA-like family protein [Fusobacterium sp.]